VTSKTDGISRISTSRAALKTLSRDESLGPDRRVKRRGDFLRIQSTGKKFRSKHLLLVVSSIDERVAHPNSSRESRLGVTITTKIDKRAARRNKLRRRLRELFRRKRVLLRRPVDLVVIALGEATELKYEQIGRELHGLLKRAQLI
jgi:ribonuclease P protein component